MQIVQSHGRIESYLPGSWSMSSHFTARKTSKVALGYFKVESTTLFLLKTEPIGFPSCFSILVARSKIDDSTTTIHRSTKRDMQVLRESLSHKGSISSRCSILWYDNHCISIDWTDSYNGAFAGVYPGLSISLIDTVYWSECLDRIAIHIIWKFCDHEKRFAKDTLLYFHHRFFQWHLDVSMSGWSSSYLLFSFMRSLTIAIHHMIVCFSSSLNSYSSRSSVMYRDL